jgi:hypothetical protein
VKYPVLALFLFGCAQPSTARNGSSASSGGTTGSTTGSTTGGTTGGQADMSGFVSRPDFGDTDLATATGDMATICDPVKQTGCGAGLKCTLDPDVPACLTNGSLDWGQVCGTMSSDDCKSSLLCIGINSSTSTCHQFCSSDSDCKQPTPAGTPSGNTAHCLTINGFAYKICSLPCDPKNPTTSCTSPLVCQLGGNATTDITNCEDKQANQTGTDTTDCSGATACAPGYLCITETSGTTSNKVCRRVCTAIGDCAGLPGGYKCSIQSPYIYGVCGPY